VHRKMRAAGVAAELHVFEGQSHAQYAADPAAPETTSAGRAPGAAQHERSDVVRRRPGAHASPLARFFDKHLAR
jgi:acetyl esterase/lipase